MSFYEHHTFNVDENRPVGYMLELHTWENDVDNYRSVSIYGLELDDLKFLIKFFSCFKSSSSAEYKFGNFGNSEIIPESSDKLMSNFKEIFNLCPPSSPDIFRDFKETIDNDWGVEDLIYDIVGIWCEGERYRVVDCFSVFYIPVEIENKFYELEELLV